MQPKFIDVAKLWEQLRNQLYVLSEINVVNEQLMASTFSPSEWVTICDAINRIAGATEATMTYGNCLETSNDDGVGTRSSACGQKALMGLPQATTMPADAELMKIVKYHSGMKVSEECIVCNMYIL